MNEMGLDRLSARIDALESQNRWLRRGMGATALLLLALFTLGQAPQSPQSPRIVTAERFVLRDAVGVTHAAFGLRPNGGADLQLYDKGGVPRVALSVVEDGLPVVALADGAGKSRLLLLDSKTGPGVVLATPDGKERLSLALRDAEAAVVMRDTNGKERLSLNVLPDGAPSVVLSDEDGKVRATLGTATVAAVKTGAVQHTAPSSLMLFDKDGKIVWKAP